MKKLFFKKILINEGWQNDAMIELNENGLISNIEFNQEAANDVEIVNGFAIPGFQNAHSHAFQYAMAGVAERHEHASNDDFWAWRETMYQIALTMSPDDLENVATMLYTEMLRHGYTHVAEFHYLHHDKNGKCYENIAEHGARLVAAAEKAGIKITLVPMFYQKGGFGMEAQPRQKRFISPTSQDYFKLLEASKAVCSNSDHATIGWGIHSLRAVEPGIIKETIESAPQNLPFHIHISEQKKEVLDAQEYLRMRPVEWLLANTPVNENFHLVHATHLSFKEIQDLASSHAHVVLCPSTEGNLGDGIFPLRTYQNLGGKWSIGTDSHVGLNPLEELRLLDYGQRLTTHGRNTFVSEQESDSGTYGLNQALLSGRKAMGNSCKQYFGVGQPFDAVVYNADFPLFSTSSNKTLTSTIVYSGDASATLGTIVNGDWVIKNHMHEQFEEISKKFKETIKQLNIR
ncbi:formimidoylglutamate deiminase [Fulvivirga sp. RKSG066]|uniref:formimidoylglutamate deiminase n=1 Tax=Fulvivirga aurantia TaxID=2529383 RepID=UPI0012BCC9E3|nr:formimidoylglutamate deiminase [Fulvivirga aurantia]MTI21227.1 formimidoylglutamate deiminase [Fulvivirga aurantia]